MTEVYPMTSTEQLVQVERVLSSAPDEEGIFDLPDHPKMDYEDIFGEPRAYREKGLGKFIHKGISKVFGGAFDYVQSTIYYILTMITGLFLGFAWGVVFGVLIYFVNWIIHPIYKFIFIFLRLAGTMIRPPIRMVLDPVFQGIGQCFTSITANIGVKLRGINVEVSNHSASNNVKELQDVY